jgi:DNA-directed RNA polymerase, mitochondrial
MDSYMTSQDMADAALSRPDALTSEMLAEQWRLEESMTQRGFEAFHREVASAKVHAREDQTAYGAVLLLHRLEAFTAGIKGFLDAANTGKGGKRHLAAKPLNSMKPETAAFLALRGVIGGLTTPRTYQYVTTAVGTMIEDELRLCALREEENAVFATLKRGIEKRVGYDYKRMYAIRVAQKFEASPTWTRIQKLHVGAKLLDILIETTGMVEVATQSEGKNKTVKYVVATEETLKWIDRRNNAVSMLRPQYEPMVVPPRDWEGAYSGGYLSSHIPPLPLVKVRSAAYLEELASAEMPVVYAAVNAIQQTAWQINAEVLAVMNRLWDESSTLAGLPPREGIEQPAKPHDIAENEEARRTWRIRSAKVRQRNMSSKGSRIAVNMTLGVANRYAKYPNIYFPCQLDFRGRVYSVTQLSPQGSDTTKGLLRFAAGKPLGESGGRWLAYQGANLAGNDKVSLEERVQWVLDNEAEILRCAADPYTHTGWCNAIGGVEIDSPWQFLAFCFEWAGYCEQGDEFVSHLPVAMDGSCSGIQHFSAMLRDPKGGAAVNLVPADKPQDVYAIVAEQVKKQMALDLVTGTADAVAHTKDGRAFNREGTQSFAKQWTEFGVTRKVTKRSVMTLAYGSKEYGFRHQVLEDVLKPAQDAATGADGEIDRDAFPFTEDGYNAAGYMAKLIWEAVTVTLVAATTAMKWLQDAASLAAAENLPVRWTTPVGFPVMQQYMDTTAHRIDTILAGKVIQLTMYKDKAELSRQKMANGISPNFVHSCDAAHLMLTVARGSAEGLTSFAMVHDSFGTTAADVEVFFRVVRESFVEIYTEIDVLGAFRDEITLILGPENREKLKPLPPTGTLDVSAVVHSRYCFA